MENSSVVMSLFRRGAGLLHLWGAHPPVHSSFGYSLTSQQVRTSFLLELSLCSSSLQSCPATVPGIAWHPDKSGYCSLQSCNTASIPVSWEKYSKTARQCSREKLPMLTHLSLPFSSPPPNYVIVYIWPCTCRENPKPFNISDARWSCCDKASWKWCTSLSQLRHQKPLNQGALTPAGMQKEAMVYSVRWWGLLKCYCNCSTCKREIFQASKDCLKLGTNMEIRDHI